jgi:hypothetical protein
MSHAMTSGALVVKPASASSPGDQRQLTALQRDLDNYLRNYGTDRAHTVRLTNGWGRRTSSTPPGRWWR